MGILLVLIGFAYLGTNFGWWGNINWALAWNFWPLLLIIFGIAIMARRWRFGYVLVILVTLLSVAFAAYMAIYQRDLLPVEIAEVKKADFSEDINGAKQAKIIIKSGAVDLSISDSTDKLVEGSAESTFGEPNINRKEIGDMSEITITTDTNHVWKFGKFRNNLDIKISNQIPVEVVIDAGASNIDVDSRNLMLKNLNIKSGASKIDVQTGDKAINGSIVSINSGASSIKISAPKSFGAEVKMDSALLSKQISGLNKINENVYQSENFSSAEKKITFDINAGASSVEFVTH